jgi:hypothetical protein
LKSIETTLNYLEQSAKKQLTHYLSSNSKDKSSSRAKEDKRIDNLDEVKQNLFSNQKELDNEAQLIEQYIQSIKPVKPVHEDISAPSDKYIRQIKQTRLEKIRS